MRTGDRMTASVSTSRTGAMVRALVILIFDLELKMLQSIVMIYQVGTGERQTCKPRRKFFSTAAQEAGPEALLLLHGQIHFLFDRLQIEPDNIREPAS